MTLVLAIVGLMAAIWTWENVHPIAGLIVGFLFVGGLGWKLLGMIPGAIAMLFTPPSTRRKTPEFIAAWEALAGKMEFGVDQTYPPPGAFQAWVRANKRTGISAQDWLEQYIGR